MAQWCEPLLPSNRSSSSKGVNIPDELRICIIFFICGLDKNVLFTFYQSYATIFLYEERSPFILSVKRITFCYDGANFGGMSIHPFSLTC